MKERREHPRAPIRSTVKIRFADLQAFVAVHAANVSAGGMFLATNQPCDRGTEIEIQFILKDGEPLIKATGEVVWIQGSDAPSGEEPQGMGIRFVTVEEPGPELIERVIQSYLKES